MIAANELRIGNWVYNTQYKENMQVEDGGHIDGIVEWGRCDPILVTPEVLEKCGFVNEGRYQDTLMDISHSFRLNEYSTIKFSYEVNKPFVLNDISYWQQFDLIRSKVYSLHQLQNLYFALTGEELNYQP